MIGQTRERVGQGLLLNLLISLMQVLVGLLQLDSTVCLNDRFLGSAGRDSAEHGYGCGNCANEGKEHELIIRVLQVEGDLLLAPVQHKPAQKCIYYDSQQDRSPGRQNKTGSHR